MRAVVTASVILLLYLGTGLFDHDIWSPTEPTVAGIVWNMHAHGELAVPRINEFVYLEKPPLYYWMALGVTELTGVLDPATLRFPSVLMGLLCLGLVYWIGRRRYGEKVACVLTLMGASCVQFYMLSHRASTDTAAMFFCFLCFALFARTIPVARQDEQVGEVDLRTVRRWDVAVALALALSFFAKNFYTFLIVVPPVAIYLLWRRELRRLLRLGGVTAVFLAVLLLSWRLALYESGGVEYLRMVFFDNTIGRFFTIAGHELYSVGQVSDAFTAEKDSSPAMYLWSLFATPAPWMFLFLVALVAFFRKGWRRRAEGRPADPFDLFLGIAFVAIPLVLTLSSSKSSQYLAPILFIDLLLIGDLLRDTFEGRRRWEPWERWLSILNVTLVASIVTLFPVAFAAHGAAGWTYSLLAIPLLALAGWLFQRLRRGAALDAWACEVGWAVTAALFLVLSAAIPEVDRGKSYAPFFEEVQRHREGLTLYTTYAGDHRLPMINYFLRTRLEVIQDVEEVPEVLRGAGPAGIVLHEGTYNLLRERIAAIPGLSVYPEEDADLLYFVSNRSLR